MVNVGPETTTEGERPDVSRTDGDTWFGHPRQLARLFTTEAMERFGYYGMRAILVLYLTHHFLFSQGTANGLYGAFTSLTYLTPLIGGFIADRYLGSKRSVKLGAIIMCIGYFMLCFGGEMAKPYATIGGQRAPMEIVKTGDSEKQYVVVPDGRLEIKGNEDKSVSLLRADGSEARRLPDGQFKSDAERSSLLVALMLLGLAAVTVGNGFFKPNISTIVGSLYGQGDRRRDAGFTIFYMGINLGSIASQFLCPIVADAFGWWAGFLIAAGGMLLAWFLFQFDGGRLAGYGDPPENAGSDRTLLITLGAIVAVPIVWLIFKNTIDTAASVAAAAHSGGGVLAALVAFPLLTKVLGVTFLIAVIGIPAWAAKTGTRQEFQMMTVAIVLVVFNVVFWMLFEQAGSSLTLFAESNTNRSTIFGTLPAGSVQVFNPVFVVVLAPVFSAMWTGLARRGLEPSIPIKFAAALILVGAGFLLLVLGMKTAGADYKVGMLWIAGLYLLHTMGELAISPVGLSMITKLSIARIVGLMMGVWFLSISIGLSLAGVVAQYASVETVGGQVANPRVSLETFGSVYWTIGWISVGIGVLLLVLSPLIKKWMHGVQ
ncbi:MAG: proton-dependent oligopeptide transporter, family [Sphingomonadales bacterium]|jgi:POT family proton-dependent oligopeptide transporter|nr:proton-dependent oligopeptide transporter, family [Sphingomonadales bacterium]